MRYLLLACLLGFFLYSLALVILNSTGIAVNLIFTSIPAMNLGLLLIISIFLGFCIGVIVALLVSKVLQKQLELSLLKKKNLALTAKLEKFTADSTVQSQSNFEKPDNSLKGNR